MLIPILDELYCMYMYVYAYRYSELDNPSVFVVFIMHLPLVIVSDPENIKVCCIPRIDNYSHSKFVNAGGDNADKEW